jgi:hypothetical protein
MGKPLWRTSPLCGTGMTFGSNPGDVVHLLTSDELGMPYHSSKETNQGRPGSRPPTFSRERDSSW